MVEETPSDDTGTWRTSVARARASVAYEKLDLEAAKRRPTSAALLLEKVLSQFRTSGLSAPNQSGGWQSSRNGVAESEFVITIGNVDTTATSTTASLFHVLAKLQVRRIVPLHNGV